MLFVVRLKVSPLGWPPSASFTLTFATSRFSGAMLLSYAQLEGGIGPFDATPTPSHTPLTICSMSSAEITAWRSALLLKGGLVWFSTYENCASDGTSTSTRFLSALTAAT